MTEWHPLRSSVATETSCTWESYNKIAEELARKVPAAAMPSLDHLSRKDYELVYEPSDDTYLLLDGIQYEFARATGNNKNKITITSVENGGEKNCNQHQQQPQEQQQEQLQHDEMQHPPRIRQALEIGCGSGVPIVYLGSLLQKVHQQYDSVVPPPSESEKVVATTTFAAAAAEVGQVVATLWATDINPHALDVARRTALENGLLLAPSPMQLNAIQCDLASTLLPQYHGCMDVILFNPPYVPTPDEEVQGHGIEASWAGGLHGRRVIDRAMPQIAQLLSRPHGVCYMITVDDNKPEELAQQFHTLGLCMRPLVRRRACNEYLTVQKLTWST
jgi:release factor glutamine methyltransferase